MPLAALTAPPTPSTPDHGVEIERAGTTASTVEFTHAARVLAREARRQRLAAPSFRCPPRMVGVQRTVRRHATGGIVAVQVRDRPWGAVLADMIEGVVVLNRLTSPDADRVRTALWRAVSSSADPSTDALPTLRVGDTLSSGTAPVTPVVGRVA